MFLFISVIVLTFAREMIYFHKNPINRILSLVKNHSGKFKATRLVSLLSQNKYKHFPRIDEINLQMKFRKTVGNSVYLNRTNGDD